MEEIRTDTFTVAVPIDRGATITVKGMGEEVPVAEPCEAVPTATDPGYDGEAGPHVGQFSAFRRSARCVGSVHVVE